jgi:hypothetical protein
MSEDREVFDPFLGKVVKISDRVSDRLRGRYAIGPTMPDGKPEFGWRQFPSPPIQHETAVVIDELRAALKVIADDPLTSDAHKVIANRAIQASQ